MNSTRNGIFVIICQTHCLLLCNKMLIVLNDCQWWNSWGHNWIYVLHMKYGNLETRKSTEKWTNLWRKFFCMCDLNRGLWYFQSKFWQSLALNTVTIYSLTRFRPQRYYPLSYGVPVRERYGSTLLPATREQHDQNCTQRHNKGLKAYV